MPLSLEFKAELGAISNLEGGGRGCKMSKEGGKVPTSWGCNVHHGDYN